jgi:CheY-like chemotaxis protein
MGRVLVGDRNLEHRRLLEKVFNALAPALVLDFAGNGEDLLTCLAEQAPHGEPALIVLDPTLPTAFSGSLVRVIKADGRFSKIPIVILADQAGVDYYALRDSGLVVKSFLKPSLTNGWELLGRRIIELVEDARL